MTRLWSDSSNDTRFTADFLDYAELFVRSNFSFLTGASHPEELVNEAAVLGYRAITIADECSFSGAVRAHVAAKEQSLKLIVGSFFRVDFAFERDMNLILLCPCREAYAQVSSLITLARRRSEKGQYKVLAKDLDGLLERPLVIWLPTRKTQVNNKQLTFLSKLFKQRLWIGFHRLLQHDDYAHYEHCLALAKQFELPMVAQNKVVMHQVERLPLQHCLTAIKHNKSVQSLGCDLLANGEQHLRSLERLQQLYPEALLQETMKIAKRCDFSLDELRYDYPDEVVPGNTSPIAYLRSLCERGAQQRWPQGVSEKTKKTLEKELNMIAEMRYEHYFLTVYDIVAFAREQGILCQGRGSAANSVVCYCLMITEVDPEQSELLFERFISKERNEPPDIDVDFEHQRREEVIQYIYKKYTRERAALAATVITYKMKSAIRDVGKALGIDLAVVDHLSRSLAWWDKPDRLQEYFKSTHLDAQGLVAQHYYQLVMSILGFPRHLSQHVGGFVITNQPIAQLVPVENASMPDRTVIQWDKYDIEALGLLKVDVLALGMLTMIRKCLQLTAQYSEISSLPDIPKEDPLTYQMLTRGDSVGVFQVESRAQMSMLPRLKPQSFYDLVIEIAIVRPGPIQGDMVHPYLRRREGQETIDYPSEAIKQVLDRTLGVPIFQEQVIQLAMVAANFSGGEADQLRRAMATWGRNGDLYKFRDKLIAGMLANGYEQPYAERVFEQMKGFGSYGFPESHSASFAILAYYSAWLKRHHSAAFYVALLNSQPMGFYSPSQLIQDAQRHGINVAPIDVDYSFWETHLEVTRFDEKPLGEKQQDNNQSIKEPIKAPDTKQRIGSLELLSEADKQLLFNKATLTIRLGLHLVKGFNSDAAYRLVEARKKQSFNNLQDLVQRAELNKQEREALTKANAIPRLARHRYQAQWQVLAVEESRPLFHDYESQSLEPLDDGTQLAPPSDMETMLMDYQTTGLTLNEHPLALLRTTPAVKPCKRANELRHMHQGQFIQVAGVVTCRQRPGTAAGVLFLTLEDETGNMNIIVWRHTVEKFRKAIMGSRLLKIKGTIERERKVVHVVAGYIEDISEQVPQFRRVSRDFH
ncbi:error-prone DNA polymerase [Pleionea litopenaei]|uniref:Error-prone DNA polymerase n=1 Tax=Pleionea litopenaei TaxID=3070815 RepID=A0AA51RVW4_9GAMM|nr:error-prone DNA polymerase [Pleionea sp. HL-JVS1]WMS88746.1 error-prone DNA polymerase [Pleionea sp. HL-JVS1]